MSDVAEFTQDQQCDHRDEPHLTADKGGEVTGEAIPNETAARECSTPAEREDAPAKSALQLVADKTDAEEGTSEAKTSKRKSLPFQLMEMEIGAIHGEHSLVEKVREESGVPLRELPTTVISKSGLMELATHLPLHVVQEQGKFYCVGGLRFFRLIQYGLPADKVMPIFLYGGLNAKKLRSHILF